MGQTLQLITMWCTIASAAGRHRGRLIVKRVSGQTLHSSEAELSPGVQQLMRRSQAVVREGKVSAASLSSILQIFRNEKPDL